MYLNVIIMVITELLLRGKKKVITEYLMAEGWLSKLWESNDEILDRDLKIKL